MKSHKFLWWNLITDPITFSIERGNTTTTFSATWEPLNHSVKNIVHHKHLVHFGVHFVWFHKSYQILFKIHIFWFWLFWCCLCDWCKTLLRRFKEFALCFLWSWWETIFQTEKWDKLSPWVVRKFSCISL